jgi:hypothetical protein
MVKVYERADTAFLMCNDPQSYVAEFNTQDSILVELETEVVNGQFAFTFNLPYEMNEEYGTIKISYYAFDFPTDASGHYSDLIVGGQPNAVAKQTAETELINFYPTIVNDYLHYTIQQDIQNLVIEIYDITGTKSSTSYLSNSLKGNQNKIDLSTFSGGFYIIHASADGRLVKRKIIKN